MKKEIENLEENKSMNMKRILTTVLGLPAVAAILIFGNNTIIDIFFGIVAIISIKEYFDAFEKSGNAKPIRWIGYLCAASISVLRLFHLSSSLIAVDEDMIKVMFSIIIFAVFVVFFHVLNSGMKKSIVDAAITIFGIIYIPVFIMFMPMLYGNESGIFLIWYVIICGWSTDVFAYLAGKALNVKKHKFSKISPNKSIEGCIAGAMRSNDCITYIHYNL